MFIGRKAELKVLEETYEKKGFQMTIVYGRRRIGKSTLITEFMRDKKASYYMASQSSLEDNVRKWSVQFIEDIIPEMQGVQFQELSTFFQFVARICKDEKIILALDEIPYIAETESSFLSQFQSVIDTILVKTNIYLIICGSAISFMEKEVMSEKSPLFGRRTNQIFLKPFDYLESAQFVPHYTNEEKAIVYGVTGGVAKYLTLFDDSLSLDQNLINNFFTSSGYLYEEPRNLLMQEFRNVHTYNTVIEVMASGANKFNEISDKAHISTASLTYIINNLITVGIVSKIYCMTDIKNKRKIQYEITDGMYNFWYRFVLNGRSSIEFHKGDVYYNAYVKKNLHDFMGDIFENMCQYYLMMQSLNGHIPYMITQVGKWWGVGHDHIPTDIDVVGIDEMGKKAILGECKFRNSLLDQAVYDDLMRKKGLINKKYQEVLFVYFSLSGFSQGVLEGYDKNEVKLVTLDDLYKVT